MKEKVSEKFRVEKTNKGFLAMWEWGGSFSHIGEATIVANQDGSPKKAIYIKRKGYLANAEHALVPVDRGDYIIYVYHRRKNFNIKIYQIIDFEYVVKKTYDEYWYTIAEERYCFGNGEWSSEIPAHLLIPVQKAMEKATCYYCREPHYVAE